MTYSTRVAKSFDLTETWGGGPEVSDATGYNSGYWFLGVTISVSPNYNGLLCAHCLPADRVDSLVSDMTDRCKSKNPDHLLRICQQWPRLLDVIRHGGMDGWQIGHGARSRTPPTRKVGESAIVRWRRLQNTPSSLDGATRWFRDWASLSQITRGRLD
jgi:hypothetical protein